ncbi:MAG TPA: hypothetical protein VFZ14_08380 [Burkholderiales bacterium]|nr:hypothetical protein [Burkholderiales bacterium]
MPVKTGIHQALWIPAFAGMTSAFAGMTSAFAGMTAGLFVMPVQTGIQRCPGFRLSLE